ncbi:hypothetical protein UP09_11850 [Bradyrhizobium sp. LTSP885]|uniref:hypothetical protein n=1 Tax=Bradyrhizobium sp. LTSP885 TaxID=1619232 RepID=UPI0005CB39CE|nr:hypothetical protein [Bradyrhizobium sp. LTSP885]KJC46709.1 hypothetical protein UP09_11850 [Bradyrhizobium sp. LTSP885]
MRLGYPSEGSGSYRRARSWIFYGYRVGACILLENHIGRFVADAEAIYSYEGTREMNTLIVGKSITGLSAFV